MKYASMGNPISTLDEHTPNTKPGEFSDLFEKELRCATQTLKRDPCVVWYLKWFRAALAIIAKTRFAEAGQSIDEVPTVNDVYRAITKGMDYTEFEDKITKHGLKYMRKRRAKVELALSYRIPKIETYPFTNNNFVSTCDEINQYLDDWLYNLRVVDMDTYPEAYRIETLIQYPDGSRWVNLHRSECPIEGKSMKDCGRTGANNVGVTDILSYRVPVSDRGVPLKNVHGESRYWKPHIHATYNFDRHRIGDIRGKCNEIPNEKYHKVIVDLLSFPWINGFTDQEFLGPVFSMSSLSDDLQYQAYLANPRLFHMKDVYHTYEVTPKYVEALYDIIDECTPDVPSLAGQHRKIITVDGKDCVPLATFRSISNLGHVLNLGKWHRSLDPHREEGMLINLGIDPDAYMSEIQSEFSYRVNWPTIHRVVKTIIRGDYRTYVDNIINEACYNGSVFGDMKSFLRIIDLDTSDIYKICLVIDMEYLLSFIDEDECGPESFKYDKTHKLLFDVFHPVPDPVDLSSFVTPSPAEVVQLWGKRSKTK